MKIDFPEQPESYATDPEGQGLELVRNALAFDPGPERVLEIGISKLIPVYSLSITTARLPNALSQSGIRGWKSCVFTSLGVIGELEYPNMGGLVGPPVEFRRGPLCSGLIDAVEEAERLDASGLWEISLLIVEGLYVEALWVRERGGIGEWFLPVPPVNKPLEPFHAYTRDQIECTLEYLAARRMGAREEL